MADDRVHIHCNTCSTVDSNVSVILFKKIGCWSTTDNAMEVKHFFNEHSFHNLVLVTENESHVLQLS